MRVILSSHADLSGSGPHKLNLSLPGFDTLALFVGGSVMQHVNDQSLSC